MEISYPIKCKMCGADFFPEKGKTVAVCNQCGSRQTVPHSSSLRDEEIRQNFSVGFSSLRYGMFGWAESSFDAILEKCPTEAEAYWGHALSRYNIEYADDPTTGERILVCHYPFYGSIFKDADFQNACKYASTAVRDVYQEEAEKIEKSRLRILEECARKEPYDIFICYAETDKDGKRTKDSFIAQDLYKRLTKKGYRVFFSRVSLKGKSHIESAVHVLGAINSAKVMLVVGTKEANVVDFRWIENEWRRFVKLIEGGREKTLFLCHKKSDISSLYLHFHYVQAYDVGKADSWHDLLCHIGKLISQERVAFLQSVSTASISSLLEQGRLFLAKGSWDMASSTFDYTLGIEPSCAEAYLGLVMAKSKCRTEQEFESYYIATPLPGIEAKNLQRAKQFGNLSITGWISDLEERKVKNVKNRANFCKQRAGFLAAGVYHTVGLKADGTVVATGDNGEGQCEISDWVNIIAVAAGTYHTVGLKADGTVVAVGDNSEGQCDVDDWADVTAIAAGAYHTVGLKANGTVLVVGNCEDQCNVEDWADIAAIAAGDDHTVGAKKDGTVVTTYDIEVENWSDIIDVAIGYRLIVGLKTDGTVLVDGYPWTSEDYCQSVPFFRSSLQDKATIAIDCGASHAVGLELDGTVAAVGENKNHQCDLDGWTDIIAVAAGEHHTAGLKAGGTVVAVGENDHGQCDVIEWKLF